MTSLMSQNETLAESSRWLGRGLRLALAGLVFLSTLPALSAISEKQNNAFEQYEVINQQTKELNLDLLAKIQFIIDSQNQKYNVANYIPIQNLPTQGEGEQLASKIIRQGMKNWFENLDKEPSSPENQRRLNHWNNALSGNLDRQGYSLQLKLKPVETTAVISYKGYVQAALSYNVAQNEAQFEVSKRVGEQTYAYTIKESSQDSSNIVGVRWNF